MDFEVRRVRADEWPALRELRLRALLDAPLAFGSTYAREAAFDDAVWIERARGGATDEDRATFVAAHDGGPVVPATGLVALATGLANDPSAGEGSLVGMFVAPEVRGRGLGDALVASVASWAYSRGLRGIELWVTETNDHAIALYRRHGFQDTNDRAPLDHTPSLMERRMTRSLLP